MLLFLLATHIQKQPPIGVPRKSYSENMQQSYRRKSMPKCDFNKVAKHGYSPVNLLHIFRTSFPKNTSGRLLLNIDNICHRMFLFEYSRSRFK